MCEGGMVKFIENRTELWVYSHKFKERRMIELAAAKKDKIMRIEIRTIDRPGMTFDILSVFVDFSVNIIWMEVYTYVIYIKFDAVSSEIWQAMKARIKGIPGVTELKDIGLIAFEQREQLIETILQHSNIGIMVVEKDGKIRLANDATMKVFNEHRPLEGRMLNSIMPIQDLVDKAYKTGKGFNNHSLLYEHNGRVCHILVSCRAVKNEANVTQCLIITINDMSDVRKMLHSVTQARSISFDDIITQSPRMTAVIELAKKIAGYDPTVLIRGESGTGKEMFARAIHFSSKRCTQPFIALNCAALPDTLVESELFGYEDGAFTGAKRGGKQGLFELAHGGTLFLDEVAELSPLIQAKLLRVLQEGVVRRIGGHREIFVNVRIIAATNRDLETMIKTGQFREDLYYRLQVIPLFIPPLREHIEDIPLLVQHFCQSIGNKIGRTVKVSDAAVEKLLRYSWPGNVRELSNVIERAVYMAQTSFPNEEIVIIDDSNIQIVNAHPNYINNSQIDHIPQLKEAVEETERKVICAALAKFRTIRGAARALGVTHTLLINRMAKLKIAKSELVDKVR